MHKSDDSSMSPSHRLKPRKSCAEDVQVLACVLEVSMPPVRVGASHEHMKQVQRARSRGCCFVKAAVEEQAANPRHNAATG